MVGGLGFAEGSGVVGDSDAELARRLDGIAATGARWIRIDFDWSGLEPSRGSFDWGYMDRIVNAATARGIKVLAILAYTPAWARPGGTGTHYPPTNPADFANFARATVDHYAGVVRHWEIWNEPNLSSFWQPAANPAAYTTLLNATYDAIKSRDPGATVVTGGTAPSADGNGSMSPVAFLNGIYDAGARGHFDAVAHHPYNYPYEPLRPESNFNWNAFGGVTPKLREVMVARGDSAKRIWATEIGVPSPAERAGIQMTPQYAATHITQAVTAWRAWAWTGPMFWYSYRDSGTNQADPEQMFGLVRRDFSPKSPALETFTQIAST